MTLIQLFQNAAKKSKNVRPIESTAEDNDVILISEAKKAKVTVRTDALDDNKDDWWKQYVVNDRECGICLEKHQKNAKYGRKIYEFKTNIKSRLIDKFSMS